MSEAGRERPYVLALISLGGGTLATIAVLAFALAKPESVVIGLDGRHDRIEGGERLASCLDCHVPFVGTPASRCSSPGCHGELATGSPPREGKAMPIRYHVAIRDERCGLCHVEHADREELEKPVGFSHQKIPEKVRDECRRCHSAINVRAHSGTDQIDCRRCHETTSWTGTVMNHALVEGEHCDVCHVAPEGEAHANLAGTCSTCHEREAWTPAKVIKK